MTFRGHIKNGCVVLDEPVTLPEGAAVRVALTSESPETLGPDENGETLAQRMLKFAGIVRGLPSDLALNHDHYLHGMPKRS